MPQKSVDGDLTKEVDELKKVREEYLNTKDEIFETLKVLKKTQIEYIDLVKSHQEYWSNELEKTEYENTVRREKLKKTLKKEDKILKKLEEGLKRTEARIEFHKKRNRL